MYSTTTNANNNTVSTNTVDFIFKCGMATSTDVGGYHVLCCAYMVDISYLIIETSSNNQRLQ